MKYTILATIASILFTNLVTGFELCNIHLTRKEDNLFQVKEVHITPLIPTTGDEIQLTFSTIAAKEIQNPKVNFQVSVLGVVVEEQEFNICKERCVITQGERVQGTFHHTLHTDIPEGVKLTFKLFLFDDSCHGTEATTCVQDYTTVKDNKGVLSARFGFDEHEVSFLYDKWKQQHDGDIHYPEKTNFMYTTVNRKNIFAQNLIKIAEHNAKQEAWEMAMNQFGHLTSEEFKRIFASGMRPSAASIESIKPKGLRASSSSAVFSTSRKLGSLANEVNWVTKGGVTPVKNQGACGSCWSFATTGALEGAYFVKYNKLVSFSEQELVSCDHVDLGCGGGAMDNAFNFIKEHNGICTEDTFPYTSGEGVRGFCNVTCTPVENSAPSSFVDVEHVEKSLMEAVSLQPVAVAIEADEAAFQFYSSGVLTAPCSQKLDHGVLLVGYGTEDDIDYWLIKNSWGPMWGLEGYIKIERGIELDEGGECGILLGPSYPVL